MLGLVGKIGCGRVTLARVVTGILMLQRTPLPKAVIRSYLHQWDSLYRVIFRSNKAKAIPIGYLTKCCRYPTRRSTANTLQLPQALSEYSDSGFQHLKGTSITSHSLLVGVSEPQAIDTVKLLLTWKWHQTRNTNTQAILNQFWSVISQLDLGFQSMQQNPISCLSLLPSLCAGELTLPDKTQLQHLATKPNASFT